MIRETRFGFGAASGLGVVSEGVFEGWGKGPPGDSNHPPILGQTGISPVSLFPGFHRIQPYSIEVYDAENGVFERL